MLKGCGLTCTVSKELPLPVYGFLSAKTSTTHGDNPWHPDPIDENTEKYKNRQIIKLYCFGFPNPCTFANCIQVS